MAQSESEREVCLECRLPLQRGLKSLGLAGSQETIWCPKCLKGRDGAISPDILEVEEPNWAIVIEWSGTQPNVKEISTVRRLDPNLQGQTLTAVMSQLRQSANWRINHLFRYDANQMLEKLRRRGIQADWWRGD
jgi:hypothetical protein